MPDTFLTTNQFKMHSLIQTLNHTLNQRIKESKNQRKELCL